MYVQPFLAQTATLAAELLGLGACYIGGIRNNPRRIIQLLDLPKLMFPVTGMTIGWPSKQGTQCPRLPHRAVLHWEHYSNEGTDTALAEYDRTMAATGIYNNRHAPAPVPGKPGKMEEYGWLEHSARRVSQPIRVELRKVLREQGFELDGHL